MPLLALWIASLRDIKKASIFTDSCSVVEILSSRILDRDFGCLILVLKNKLSSAFLQDLDIILIWIPTHVSILGNETANHLTREATRHGETIDFLPPHTDLCTMHRERYIAEVKGYFLVQADQKGAQYFSKFLSPTLRSWFDKSNLSRKEIVTINRIRSARYNLNFSLFRCGIVGRPDCPCGFPF